MLIRVAINGYGRIGRNILRAVYESGYRQNIEIVAINDLGDAKINAHLTQFDSVHGLFSGKVSAEENAIIVNGDRILAFSEKNPAKLPWKDLNVDIVLECTGKFTSREKAQ